MQGQSGELHLLASIRLKAFLIVLAISTALGAIAFVVFLVAARSIVEEALRGEGVAEVEDYEVRIDAGSCKIEASGTVTASGVFTNKADRQQRYNIIVDYYDNTNTKRRSDVYIPTGALDKDAKMTWHSSVVIAGKDPESITCKVSQVNYAIAL